MHVRVGERIMALILVHMWVEVYLDWGALARQMHADLERGM
jgi:hypothetical protein